MIRLSLLSVLTMVMIGCSGGAESADTNPLVKADGLPPGTKSLVVAGGCFWCVEKDFETQPGVLEAVSGYGGGKKRDATYQDHEGHREVVEVFYDPQATDYATLIDFFLRTIDVTDSGGQFCDRGFAYTTAIHYRTPDEANIAKTALAKAEADLAQPIVTPALPIKFVVQAEDYHQDYYKKNALRYNLYRNNCRRDKTVKSLWGDAWGLAGQK